MSKRIYKQAYSVPQKLIGRSQSQQRYINSINEFNMVVAEGDAGTGKTFPPSVIAVDMYNDPRSPVETIQLVRPNIELGDPIGFLKGDLYEKMTPWLVPFMDGFEYRLKKPDIRTMVNNEVIVPVPTAFLRGRTWNNCFVIVDEAQNLRYEEMKCILRRIGNDCKIVICADLDQCDLPDGEATGMKLLYDIDDVVIKNGYRAPYCWNDLEESVRSDVCQWFGEVIKEVEGVK